LRATTGCDLLSTALRGHEEVCGCFPTGRHYPGLAERIASAFVVVKGLAEEYEAAASWSTSRLVVIDFETTGLEPESDRVIEVGLVCFDGGEMTARRHWLINPGIPVPAEAREVHGIGDEELASAPRFEAVFGEIVELVRGRVPVAYNAEFDRRFFHAEAKRLGGESRGDSPPALRGDVVWVDPLVWVRELHKYEKSRKLSDVCARLGIALEQAHRAAGDAEATGRVLLALATQMPRTYGELIRLQGQYAARQDVDIAAMWRMRRGGN
jgi:DNA polymerase-3 subunit epsilon